MIKKLMVLIIVLSLFSSCSNSNIYDKSGSQQILTTTVEDNNKSDTTIQIEKEIDKIIIVNNFESDNTDIYKNNFHINNDEAVNKAIDEAINNKIISENDHTKFMCNDIKKINNKQYYYIKAYNDSIEDPQVTTTLFFMAVDVNEGSVYIIFDPTLDSDKNYAYLAGSITDEDGRTRLINLDD